MGGCRPDGRNFFGWIARRLPPFRVVEGTAHPRRDREPLAFREPADFGKLLVGQKHLQSFTHDMSIKHTPDESTLRGAAGLGEIGVRPVFFQRSPNSCSVIGFGFRNLAKSPSAVSSMLAPCSRQTFPVAARLTDSA